MKLSEENCKLPRTGDVPLSPQEANELSLETPLWTVVDKAIERDFNFKDFKQSMAFVNKVAELAELQNHHPDIYVTYSKVKLVLSTHKIGGLSRNDFILAAMIDLLTKES
jgi:4a-hydroxytetrahydrobiopterin dehydratase